MMPSYVRLVKNNFFMRLPSKNYKCIEKLAFSLPLFAFSLKEKHFLYGILSCFSSKAQIYSSSLSLRGASSAQQGLVHRTVPKQCFRNINPTLLINNPFNPWEYQERQKIDSTNNKNKS